MINLGGHLAWRIEQWDVTQTPWPLESESVQCVVTSPPYWGLRNYGVDGQIGLEPTPAEYVEKIVQVFREVRRVLRKDGTVWLNLGDCYSAGSMNGAVGPNSSVNIRGRMATSGLVRKASDSGLKPKDLVGIPWRVAFALQADGWWLRSDIVWAKPNPMPESIRDRPTRAHEYVFLLTKSRKYFYDADAISWRIQDSSKQRINQPTFENQNGGPKDYGEGSNRSARRSLENLATRNRDLRQVDGADVGKESHATGTRTGKNLSSAYAGVNWGEVGVNARTVWQIATDPFPESHFAVFPTELARRCILAGTSEAGACDECGAPWVRIVEREASTPARENYHGCGSVPEHRCGGDRPGGFYPNPKLMGFRPTCSCNAPARPCLVLDPFSGAGTVALVADTLGRDAVGLELNPEYVEMSRKRIRAPRTEEGKLHAAMEADGQIPMVLDALR